MPANLIPLSLEQRRMLIDTQQTFNGWCDAKGRQRSFAGGMMWKTARGRQYLVRVLDSRGTQKSLGPRGPDTEVTFGAFHQGKAELGERLKSLDAELAELARFNKAARINRVPGLVADVMSSLDQRGLMGTSLHVIGTNALYGYEAVAAVMVKHDLLATRDLDIMWDARRKLRLAGEGIEPERLIDALKKADRSFEPLRGRPYTAVNNRGFEVDLIKPTPHDPIRTAERDRMADGDLLASQIPALRWLMNAPKTTAVAIAENGFPVRMSVPDPRAFAIYKEWLAHQSDREPVKRARDAAQAVVVADLVREYMPHLKFDDESLGMFPQSIRQDSREIARSEATAAAATLQQQKDAKAWQKLYGEEGARTPEYTGKQGRDSSLP